MKVYKLEVIIIDLDEIGKKEIRNALENTRYPNHCIAPYVIDIEEKDIGEWNDDHPLNGTDTQNAEIERLFGVKVTEVE